MTRKKKRPSFTEEERSFTMNNFKKGDKVLVRVMECVDEKNNQWEVLYKTGIISQESILRTDKNELYNVQFICTKD